MRPCEFLSAIPSGFEWRIRSIGISLALLTTLTFDTQAHVEMDMRIITEDHRDYQVRRNSELEWSGVSGDPTFLSNDEELLTGRSGDPWGSKDGPERDSRSSSRLSENQTQNASNTNAKKIHSRRLKRSVVHLYNMVVCATGCNPMSYKGYGCYCGFLGSGSAVDGIDHCCRMHDRCYDATECPSFLEYFVPYYWKCYRGHKPICAVVHGKWGGSGSCAQRLCECDRALSECLRRFPCPRSKAVCTTSPWRLIQNVFMIF